ncbi:SLC13 family permease [Maridesulfovibrio sp.]|uniref:SLC13 family permease n=1 Tax=Maridesulfovibrio sp. TaxID=2795000 RepID=UPI003BAA64C6
MLNTIGTDALLAIAIFLCAAIFFLSNKVRGDIIGVFVVTSLQLTGILSLEEALSGFSNPVLIVLVVMFIVSEALTNTGIAQRVGVLILRIGGKSDAILTALLMLAAGCVGSFMNSTATMGIFIPIALAVAKKAHLNKKRLLMPLGFAALISGMMTLVASSQNLIANETLIQAGYANLDFFSFTPIGIIVLAVAVIYIQLFGKTMLGSRKAVSSTNDSRTIPDLIKNYGLQNKGGRYRIRKESPLIGLTPLQTRFRRMHDIMLVVVERPTLRGRSFNKITPETTFKQDDIIIVFGEPQKLEAFALSQCLDKVPPISKRGQVEMLQELGMAEILIAPDSRYIGQTLSEISFRNNHNVSVLGLRRKGKVLSSELTKIKLSHGDALLVCGSWEDIHQLKQERVHFLLLTLPEESCEVFPARRKAPLALLILIAMVTAMAFEILPPPTIALLTALCLVFAKCVELTTIYRRISWPTIVLVGGMLPMATALTKSGASDYIAVHWVSLLGQLAPMNMLGVLFFSTAMVGWFLPSAATAVLMLPIAIEVATELGMPPHAFAMTSAIAIGCAFVSPISSPTNLLTMEAGDYSPTDFIKTGFPLLCLASVITVSLMSLIYL